MQYKIPSTRQPLFILLFIGITLFNYRAFSSAKPDAIETPYFNEPAFDHPNLEKPKLLEKTNYKEALSLYKEVANQFKKEKNWMGYSWTLNQVAKVLLIRENYDSVYNVLEKALECEMKYLGEARRVTSNTYYFLGEYYFWIGKPHLSVEAFVKALEIRKKIFDKNDRLVINIYLELGKVYRHLFFDYNKANEYLQKVLENEGTKSLSTTELYSLYYDLASTNELNKDFDRALLYASQALNLGSILRHHSPYYLGNCYSVIASIHQAKSEYDGAIKNYHLAIEIWEHNRLNEDIAYDYNALAGVYIKQEKFLKAIPYLKKSLRLLSNDHYKRALNNSFFLSKVYLNLGQAYQGLHNFDSALVYLNNNVELSIKSFGENHPETAKAYNYLGLLFHQFGREKEALRYYQESIISEIPSFKSKDIFSNPTIESIANKYHVFGAIANKADALKKSIKNTSPDSERLLKEALSNYLLADELMASYVRSYTFEDAKLQFVKSNISIYEEAIDCVYRLYGLTKDKKYVEHAFTFMEKSKAVVLLEALKEAEMIANIGIPESVKNEDKSLIFELAHNEKKLIDEQSSIRPDQDKIKKIQENILDIDKRHEDFKKSLAQNYPAYYKTRHHKLVVNLNELNSYLQNSEAEYLEYFWGVRSIFALYSSGYETKFVRIENSKKLQEQIQLFTNQFVAYPEYFNFEVLQKEYDQYVSLSYYIYEQLFAPFLSPSDQAIKRVPGSTKLIVVPDGLLAQVPVSALIRKVPVTNEVNYKDLEYLLKSFSISSVFSATSLLTNTNPHSGAGKPLVLGMSYSSIGQFANNVRNSVTEISGTSKELTAISSLFDGDFYKGEDASEHVFKTSAANYDILHLAVHGIADPESKYSKLIFKSTKDTVEDGYLHPYELYSLNLKAKLVVLSACETGLGKFYSGEGLYSIARGFAYAGCPAIISTLWKIDDHITTTLIKSFYEKLSEELAIDEALRYAQLNYLTNSDELNGHPRYWAGFISMGDMGALGTPSKPKITIAMTIAITIVIGGGIFAFGKHFF